MERRIPDWQLERFLLDELPASERQRLEAELGESTEAQARLAELTRSNGEIMSRYSPAEMVGVIERKAGFRRLTWTLSLGVPALAAASVLLVMVVTQNDWSSGPTSTPSSEVTRVKGEPQLMVFRRQADAQAGDVQAELDRASAQASAGDTLQLAYLAGDYSFGAILSVDGRGTVTVHYPDSDVAAVLSPKGVISLPYSYELDDAPYYERFFFVVSDVPFAVDVARTAAEELARSPLAEHEALLLPLGLTQVAFTIRKVGTL